MRFFGRIALIAAVAALFPPAAGAEVRTFPGCGATLADCMNLAPAGTTIRLRTNAVVPIPDSLTINKALNLEPAPGFKPKIGPTGTDGMLRFSIPAATGGVSIRGIVFTQVGVDVVYGTGTHRTVFDNNRIRLNTGSSAADGIAVSYSGTSRGPISIRGNDISSSGEGVIVFARDGRVEIVGNLVTSSRVGDSELGILFVASAGHVRATITSNLVHHVADCNCGLSSGIVVSPSGTADLDAAVLNNTVANIGAGTSSFGFLIRPPSMPPGQASVQLYNNVVSVAGSGITLEAGSGLHVVGDRNDTFATTSPNQLGSHDLGTVLHRNPRFKSASNYRLRPTSRLANAAAPCVAGSPLPRSDAGRRFRYFGPGLDIGAFERGSTVSGSVKGKSKTGTNARNRLVGTRNRDVLCGLGGGDRLLGLGGSDFLFGGRGGDRAFGGAGNDRIDLRDGVRGNDAGDGGTGRDVCVRDTGDGRTSC